ncbi:hypothetical protein ACH5RR_002901 [Cinchona calisaya]|uniref:Late blight resistance protein homolog R1A-3 n=1 Tax=Cinchona calisaya TaxID=153742 RepID=A0ABD3ATE1_9GENT
MAASNFRRFDSAIDSLRQQLKHLCKSDSTGLLDNNSLHVSLSSDITNIDIDTKFLETFVNSITKWTDAATYAENVGSHATKIDALIGEIADELAIVAAKKYISKGSLPEVLQVVTNSQAKIELLKAESGQVFEFLISYTILVNSFFTDFSNWIKFMESTRKNLMNIHEKFHDDSCGFSEQFTSFDTNLSLLKYLINSVGQHFTQSGFQMNQEIDDFIAHVASVVVRTANKTCYCWFKKIDLDGILVLQNEIDPTNPEFFELCFKFVKAVNKSSLNEVDVVPLFLNYLLKLDTTNDLYRELISLVSFVVNKKLEEETSRNINVQSSCVGEIKDLLFGVGFIYQPLVTRDTPDPHLCNDLLTKICLLKFEFFLEEQFDGSTLLLLSGKRQIKELGKVVHKLRNFCQDLRQEKVEHGKQIVALIEEVDEHVRHLYQSCQEKKTAKCRVRDSVLILLTKIVLFKAKSVLMELLRSSVTLMDLREDQIEIFLEGLELFAKIVTKQQIEITEDVESIFRHIQAALRRITCLSYFFLAKNITEEMIEKMILSFLDLVVKMDVIKAKLKDMCPKIPVFNVPMTNELGFMDLLLQNLLELLKYNHSSIAPIKHRVDGLQSQLEFLKCFLKDISESDTKDLELGDLGKRVTNTACKLAYVIDLIEIDSHWQNILWFYDLLEEIRLIKLQVTRINEKTCECDVRVEHISSRMISHAGVSEISEMVVRLRDEEEVIIDRLTRGSSQRDIVSIVGMPGIGKTTLARSVYNDATVAYHFHRRAWCSVSQVYEKRELLLDIIRDIDGLSDEIHGMTDEDLELKLSRLLRKNRYLIVMDDLWDIEALNDLVRSFPDDRIGSRILITSRLHKVALEAKPDRDPHFLRLLSKEESWNLLEMKIFHKEGCCPEDLVEVGKEIAQLCKGLPLSVVAISGILERTTKKHECWSKISQSLSSRIIRDPETPCKDILQLSYMHLPAHLRECFLYFGAFLEDKDIPVSKLIRLWIAEGFVEKNEAKNLEDAAEDNLMELVDRSLVMVSKRRSNGRVKTCRVHDLLHDLCLYQAKEDNFLLLISRSDEPYASFDGIDYGADFYNYYPLNPVPYDVHRLCFCLKRKHFVDSRPSGPCTRSLIFLACNDTYPKRRYNVSFISQHFKLLRVLDLECINIGISFPTEIELLVHLRYLAMSGDMDSIPGSIHNLWRLETFIVKGLSDKIVLPFTIWCMASLRHLHINNYADFCWQDDTTENCFQLDNLVTFSSPFLPHGMDVEMILRKLVNLRKLRCIFQESLDASRNCNQFPRLDFLTQLESLRIIYYGKVLNPAEFSLPMNLKKLTLTNFRLPWDKIYFIGRLPNLEVLKLLSRAFDGPRWNMGKGEFCNLKFLMLDTLNIAQWNASCDYLPKLHQLVVQNCKDLEEVPCDFEELATLQMIEVKHCSKSVEDSVRKIKEANDEIKVIIS